MKQFVFLTATEGNNVCINLDHIAVMAQTPQGTSQIVFANVRKENAQMIEVNEDLDTIINYIQARQ